MAYKRTLQPRVGGAHQKSTTAMTKDAVLANQVIIANVGLDAKWRTHDDDVMVR